MTQSESLLAVGLVGGYFAVGTLIGTLLHAGYTFPAVLVAGLLAAFTCTLQAQPPERPSHRTRRSHAHA